MGQPVDLLIIGGGINGAGIARDAAGRGLSVLLVEQDDLAAHTSSASSKLIHGGLRYLEHGEFRLVREALAERERLLAIAPHIIRPLRFVLPHDGSLRPAWMIRLGLFLYDRLGGNRRLAGSVPLRFAEAPEGAPLKPGIARGFAYSDCAVDDSRLVVLNALDAAERGAVIRTRTRLVAARRCSGLWRAELQPAGGEREIVTARAIVNAAGPWVASVLRERLGAAASVPVRLVKGSHVVVNRLYPGDHAFILQNPDRRIVFVIPYQGAFTLIGTTDLPFAGEPGPTAIEPAEIDYLLDSVGRWFRRPVDPATIVWSYSGIRPLHGAAAEDAASVTRDYLLELDGGASPPLLSVFGGKITTYRRLAEHALAMVLPLLGLRSSAWTDAAPLPGGDIPRGDPEAFAADLTARHEFLPAELARRLAHGYGTRADVVLGGATRLADLGADFGLHLHRAEIDYLVRHEWARTAEDILWRRTKLGLRLPAGAAERLDRYLGGHT